MSNPHEELARERKASRIAEALREQSIPVEVARSLGADDRRMLAGMIGVNPPSAATWDMAMAVLDGTLVRRTTEQVCSKWYAQDDGWIFELPGETGPVTVFMPDAALPEGPAVFAGQLKMLTFNRLVPAG